MQTPNNFSRPTSLISPLFPEEVITEEVFGTDAGGELWPEEETFVHSAAPKRKTEFTAGRSCARRALSRLSMGDCAILVGEAREPVWPSGIVGSITHSHDYCGVAISRQDCMLGIGLDAELVREDVEDGVWRLVCDAFELSWIDSLPLDEQSTFKHVIFSAKESIYKLQYPLSRQWVGFKDVRVSIDRNDSSFCAEFLVGAGNTFPKRRCISGKYRICAGYVFTGVVLARPDR